MNAYEQAGPEHRRMVDELIGEMRANQGLAPIDLAQFWKDQAVAAANSFGAQIPQVSLGAILNRECVFAELGEEEDTWRYLYGDDGWSLELNRRYNDLSEKIVGRRLLKEEPPDRERQWPAIKELYDIFEAENVWEGGKNGSWWLKQIVDSAEALPALLDRVEARLENLREFLLPDNWDEEKKRLTALGCPLPLYRGQRGPCTFACSIVGAENMLFLCMDDPKLARRFSDVLSRAILERARVIDEEAGYTPETAPRGWGWLDDNSCLFNPAMYELFAMPILRAVFARYAPDPKDWRYQHSDSNMAHLLPLLSEVDLLGTNFGPSLTVAEIRQFCPHARIDGQLAPFTYSRNEEENMVAEFLRDFEQARETRGLNFATAGSINNGSRLTGMRLLMAAIQRFGRY